MVSLNMNKEKTYRPYLFFAPQSEEEEKEKKGKRQNKWKVLEVENMFLYLDLETQGFFQDKVIFGGLIINDSFIFGYNEENDKDEIEKWLNELFCDEERLKDYNFILLSLNRYFDYIYNFEGYIVGANPLFDLSRGIDSYSTTKVKKPSLIRGGNIIKVKDRGYGDIIRKYHKGLNKEGKKIEVLDSFILNVLQLGTGITGKPKIGLKKLSETLNTKTQKLDYPFEKIKNNKETLRYMIYDILTTKECYEKLYEMYDRDIGLMKKVVSSASVGKNVLGKCNIHKPRFTNEEDKRRLYEAYFGGRSEVNFRGRSEVKLENGDFLSQYPILQIILNLQRFMLSEEISVIDRTNDKELRDKLGTIHLNDLKKPQLWKELSGLIVKIKVKEGRVPIRIKYKDSVNVQLPYVTTSKPLWYSIFDYLGCKLYIEEDGRGEIEIAEIKEYVSVSKQKNLKSTTMFGITIEPETMFKDLLLYRMSLKKQQKTTTKGSKEYQRLDELIWGIKLILNSTSYGSTIERNETTQVKFYEYFNSDNEQILSQKKLAEGIYNCPIIGVQITSSAKLLMVICEILELQNNGHRLPYIDTDGMSSLTLEDKREFFKRFSPIPNTNYLEYDSDEPTFFYGISPKRYIKYSETEIYEKGMRIHGLGSYPFFVKNAKEFIGYQLGLIKDEETLQSIKMKLNRNVITKISTNTSLTLSQTQEKVSWVKPYSFGWKSLPDKFMFMDVKGSQVRNYNETLSELNDSQLEDYVLHKGLMTNRVVLKQFFAYEGQKYDIEETGWNKIPYIQLSNKIRYISKIGGEGFIDEPESFISEKEKGMEKKELKQNDKSMVNLYIFLYGIINTWKQGILKNYRPSRGLTKELRKIIKEKLEKK